MIKGLLFDLDGVFYVSNRILDGANATIEWVNKNKLFYKFITNTTTLSRKDIAYKLKKLGLKICEEDIISANYAGACYLKKIKPRSCKLILTDSAKYDYQEFKIQKENPEFIIIGDIGSEWNYDLMNELLNDILNGSKIIALHKGRYFQTDNGLNIDTGAFIAGLEYVTNTSSHVIGKPSKSFFDLAIRDFNLPYHNICMVGDDLYNDIESANNLGLFSTLVKTGKYRKNLFEQSDIKPNLTIESIAHLPLMLGPHI